MTVTYTVKVYTGDIAGAGTLGVITFELIGEKGKSERIILSKKDGGYKQDSVGTCDVHCPSSLGKLFLVQLELKEKSILGIPLFADPWYCSKVVVATPEGETVVFPVYSWLELHKPFGFRDSTGVLVFNETIHAAKISRMNELEYRRDTYKWTVLADGLPEIVKCDNPSSLPLEVQFSCTKGTEFIATLAFALLELKLEGFLEIKKPWPSIEEIHGMHVGKSNPLHDYVEKHWKEDEFFADQFLNGINPMLICQCSKLPENFPVTEAMAKESLAEGMSLEEEMKKGHIFLVDYKRLDGIMPNNINGKPQFLAAPLVLLWLKHHDDEGTPQHKLMPIAIQLKQKPGDTNPIFLPSDLESDWLLAKIFVRAADFIQHELEFHLLHTHLLSEVFTMATLRNFPMVHPLYKLLIPHFRYTLQINILARAQLISKDGIFTKYSAVGEIGLQTILERATASLTYSSLCLPDNIDERGLNSLPNFHYRDDGMKLWRQIYSYVEGVVRYYYTCDQDVTKDTELQAWITDVFVRGFLFLKETGIPESFSSIEELVKFLTMVIFTATAQHAAVNNGQFGFYGWMPNGPISLQQAPPEKKGCSTQETILNTLPDINVTSHGMATVFLLSKPSTDFVQLGHAREELFVEKIPVKTLTDFGEGLKKIEREIISRNDGLTLPYNFLNPAIMENSIAL